MFSLCLELVLRSTEGCYALPKVATLYRRLLRLRRRRRRLEVVRVEVLLEVEVRQLVALLEAEQREQLGVGVDITLVHEVVLLDVARDELRDVRAALERTGGAAEERAELRGDARRHLEEADTRRLALLALNRRLAAAALVGDLLHLGRRLLEALGLADELRQLLAHLDEARRERLDLRLDLLLLDLGRLALDGHRSHNGRDSRRSRHSRLSLGRLLRGLGLRRRSRRRNRRRRNRRRRSRRGRRSTRRLANNLRRRRRRRRSRRSRDRRNSYILFLRHTLSSDRLDRGSRAHNTRGRDRRRGHFTQD